MSDIKRYFDVSSHYREELKIQMVLISVAIEMMEAGARPEDINTLEFDLDGDIITPAVIFHAFEHVNVNDVRNKFFEVGAYFSEIEINVAIKFVVATTKRMT